MDAGEVAIFERSLRAATQRSSGAVLDAALDDLGWSDALHADRRAAVSILFELQGEAGATSSALDRLLATALGGVAPTLPVVLPAGGSVGAPGSVEGGQVVVQGLAGAGIVDATRALVAAHGPQGTVVLSVPLDQLSLRPVHGLDPWLGLVEVSGTPAFDDAGAAGADWAPAVALAQVAIGHELVGASRTMLALARAHALERIQFGSPISTFQAVRHRLADTLIAIETADAMLDAAWEDGEPVTASMAKALAGRGARTAARHCQQVLAGIGFTTEHELHRYVRRVLVLDQLFGASRTLTRQLGNDLLTTRRLPTMLPL